ncbi:TetR/AcrR family transcriptional regulator [Microlunatus elymi]|uniref:TetR/AcrR family transcriptional regulator n=1 Tax=Microlunatus elymi TaxID=2596828 RepID=A0A516Q631_9ACTN|nr:TetR/AcrR family transcriptional regulator [Microlunatus elymi]
MARRRDAVANRTKLVDAAAAVFAERGVDAPLEAIARRAQVSIGTLYNHFRTREQLLDAIYPDRIADLAAAADAALADEDSWLGFSGFLLQVFELQATDRGLNDAMTLRYPDAALLTEACDRGFARAGELIKRAQLAGTLRKDFTVEDLAFLIWATSRVIAATADIAPTAWRRYVGLQLDGLRAAAAHRLPVPAMTPDQVAQAMQSRP